VKQTKNRAARPGYPDTQDAQDATPPLHYRGWMVSELVQASARQLELDLKEINRGARTEAKHRRRASFARGFVLDDSGCPPLQRLLTGDKDTSGARGDARRGDRSGRGPGVRFRIYLCVTLMAVADPFDVDREEWPTYRWNPRWYRRLGLPTGGNSYRVLRYNLEWLAAHKFIEVKKRGGYGPAIKLLHIDGTGRPYEKPSSPYCQLPATAFTNGWLAHLSPTAMSVALMIDNQRRRHDLDKPLGERTAAIYGYDMNRYALSADAWRRGAQELAKEGLLTYELKQTAEDAQTRNRYLPIEAGWDHTPGSTETEVHRRS
jgi:hypothetical protein